MSESLAKGEWHDWEKGKAGKWESNPAFLFALV